MSAAKGQCGDRQLKKQLKGGVFLDIARMHRRPASAMTKEKMEGEQKSNSRS